MVKEVVIADSIRYIMTVTELVRADYSKAYVYTITVIYSTGKVTTYSYEDIKLANRVFEALTEV